MALGIEHCLSNSALNRSPLSQESELCEQDGSSEVCRSWKDRHDINWMNSTLQARSDNERRAPPTILSWTTNIYGIILL
jgi:hypothetical protein